MLVNDGLVHRLCDDTGERLDPCLEEGLEVVAAKVCGFDQVAAQYRVECFWLEALPVLDPLK